MVPMVSGLPDVKKRELLHTDGLDMILIFSLSKTICCVA